MADKDENVLSILRILDQNRATPNLPATNNVHRPCSLHRGVGTLRLLGRARCVPLRCQCDHSFPAPHRAALCRRKRRVVLALQVRDRTTATYCAEQGRAPGSKGRQAGVDGFACGASLVSGARNGAVSFTPQARALLPVGADRMFTALANPCGTGPAHSCGRLRALRFAESHRLHAFPLCRRLLWPFKPSTCL